MARTATKTKRKIRSPKFVDEKHVGSEITEWDKVTNVNDAILHGLRHYGYFYDQKDALAWTKDWLKANRPKDVKPFSKAHNWRVPITLGGLCKMHGMGAPLREKELKWINDKIDQIILYGKSDRVIAKKTENRKSPAELVNDRIDVFLSNLESVVDDFIRTRNEELIEYPLYDELTKEDAPYRLAKSVHDFYDVIATDLKRLVGRNKDPDLDEAFANVKIADRKKTIKFYDNLVDQASSYMAGKLAAKKPRKTRARAAKPASKVVSTVQYKASDTNLQVTSTNPENLVGASVVVLFNTKYSTMTYLEGDSMTVKGTTIQNFDDGKSFKKTLRKPEENLTGFVKCTKAKVKKNLEALKTKSQTATGRINSDTIILRVFK